MSSKEKILGYLEQNKGEFISGELMAYTLGISRNAIWKAVNELRQAGYKIDAVKNRGYCLTVENDILSVQGIASYMKCQACINLFDAVDSTNQKAKEIAIRSVEHGRVIIAKQQTQGRGHYDTSFSSPEGGIYLSVIVDPEKLSISRPAEISAWAATAACRALEESLGTSPQIELVTDIFLNNEKIAGILTESAFDFETEKLQWIVVGIGIPRRQGSYTKNQLVACILDNLLMPPDAKHILAYYKMHHV